MTPSGPTGTLYGTPPPGAEGDGLGGAVFDVDGSLSVSQSTIAYNTVAGGSSLGGGVYSLAFGNTIAAGSATTASVLIVRSILHGNTGTGGGADDLALNRLNRRHTNTSHGGLSGVNLIGTTSTRGGALITGTPVTTDPLLGPLQSNGGSLETIKPGPGSPALGAGGDCGVTDELGTPRPTNGCDLGALEETPATVRTVTEGRQRVVLLAPSPGACIASGKPLGVGLTSTPLAPHLAQLRERQLPARPRRAPEAIRRADAGHPRASAQGGEPGRPQPDRQALPIERPPAEASARP